MPREDPFRRLDYRRFVAWPQRLERELPFLRRTFGEAGRRPLLDVGCGTGEHVDALTGLGHRVVGLDVSPAMLAKARAAFPGLPFVAGDMARLPLGGTDVLGGALCLGNTLAILREDDECRALFGALRRLLVPGAPLLIQILNYHRLRERGLRHLPLNFRSTEDGGELLYLRLLDPIDARRLRFEVLTLERLPPEGESRLVQVTSAVMRPLEPGELAGFLGGAGFREVRLHGDFAGGAFAPSESPDVVAVAR